jgi:uncharacterized protein with LGFP repeats
MSRRRAVPGAVFGRIAIGLFAIALTVPLAPLAVAQPEKEAEDAISAAWDANGGDGGPLGPKASGVYSIGGGFGQDFAGGKIFFTPATGARVMKGAILEKYESLGGPADSDLGFPNIDEGPGRAPGSLNTTFNAPDNPVIFWTPSTGARVVRGPINAAWDKLGGSAGVLGVPAEDEAYRGDVITQKFTGGELSFNTSDKTFTTVPAELAEQLGDLQIPDDPTAAINAARRAAGGPLGPLGASQGPPYPIGADGLAQDFANGKIFFTPATGASVLTGQVLAKYESVGGPEGDFGFPTDSEVDGGLATPSRMATFAADDKPVIFWTPDYGAVIVRGAMSAAWDRLDGAKGTLGAPMADQTENGDVVTQRFSGGVVSWDRSTNKFTTEPSNLASDLSGLEVPGQTPVDEPDTQKASESGGSKWFRWSWWWLVALIPVVALIGVVAFATMRRGGRGEDPFADDTGYNFAADEDESRYAPVGASARTSSTDDEYNAIMFGDRYANQGLGSLPSRGDESVTETVNLWREPTETEDDEPREGPDEPEFDQDSDAIDTAPLQPLQPLQPESPVPPPERNPFTDTGRHARIEDEPPAPPRTAFLLPLDDPDEAPEGYPIKANTRSGRYWTPNSEHYDDAVAEIWFATVEIARANGFVSGDDEPA